MPRQGEVRSERRPDGRLNFTGPYYLWDNGVWRTFDDKNQYGWWAGGLVKVDTPRFNDAFHAMVGKGFAWLRSGLSLEEWEPPHNMRFTLDDGSTITSDQFFARYGDALKEWVRESIAQRRTTFAPLEMSGSYGSEFYDLTYLRGPHQNAYFDEARAYLTTKAKSSTAGPDAEQFNLIWQQHWLLVAMNVSPADQVQFWEEHKGRLGGLDRRWLVARGYMRATNTFAIASSLDWATPVTAATAAAAVTATAAPPDAAHAGLLEQIGAWFKGLTTGAGEMSSYQKSAQPQADFTKAKGATPQAKQPPPIFGSAPSGQPAATAPLLKWALIGGAVYLGLKALK